MLKHAPAPWTLLETGDGEWLVSCGRSPDPVTRARHLIIADVMRGSPIVPGETWEWLTSEEAKANLQLILASPDLLRLARGLTRGGGDHEDGWIQIGPEGWDQLQALLKKLEDV